MRSLNFVLEGGSSESFQAGMPGSSRQVEEKSASSEIKKTQPPPVTGKFFPAVGRLLKNDRIFYL